MSVLSSYETKLIIDIYTPTNLHISSSDIYISDVLYENKILNNVAIGKELSDIYWGVAQPKDVVVQLNDSDGYFSGLIAAGTEFRNVGVKIQRYEPLDSPTTSFELYGVITEYVSGDIFEITLSVQDPDPFQADFPKKVYETTDWSQAYPLIINPKDDLGEVYNLCFGECKKVPLRYVHADFNDYVVGGITYDGKFDYIIGPGTIESNNTNKATKVKVYHQKTNAMNEWDQSLYYVHDGSTTIQSTDAAFGMSSGAANPYIKDGISYAFIRFNSEQGDYSGGMYDVVADLWGLKLGGSTAQRNFARIIQYILWNGSWGLNLNVNTASFDTAATALDTIGSMYADFVLHEQNKAQDIITGLLRACRGNLDKNEAGERTLTIDTYTAPLAVAFGSGDGTANNIKEHSNYRKTSTKEAMKTFTLNYRPNLWKNKFVAKNKRTVLSFGEDIAEDCPYIRQHVTADKVTCFIKNYQVYGDTQLSILVGMEGRSLRVGDVISVVIPRRSINSSFKIKSANKNLNDFQLDLISYSSSIYTYTAGTMPTDENDDPNTDLSLALPNAPTSLLIDSSGTYITPDGFKSAYVILKADIPVDNLAVKVMFGYKKYGESIYTYVDGAFVSGSTWKVRIDGLGQAFYYDYVAQCVSLFGKVSINNPTLAYQIAPSDTTRPATPTGLTPTVGTGKMVGLKWTKNTEPDLSEYVVYRADGPSFTTYNKIGESATEQYNDIDVTIGTAYRYRVAAVDTSENPTDPLTYACAYVSATPVDSGNADTTPPAQITNFARTGEGTYQTGDGRTLACINFSWTNPTDHWAFTFLLYKEHSATTWAKATPNYTAGAVTGFVDDLVIGRNYDFTVVGINRDGVPGVEATWVNRTAPGDTTAPAAPTWGPTPIALGTGKSIILDWADNTEKDLASYCIYRGVTANSANATKISEARISYFVDSGVAYGTTYYYWLKAKDFTGLESPFSYPQSIMPIQVGDGDISSFDAAKLIGWLSVNRIPLASITDALISNLTVGKLTINPALRNLCLDGNFETGNKDNEWQFYGAPTVFLNAGSHSGSWCLSIQSTGVQQLYACKKNIPVTAGASYHFESWRLHDANGLGITGVSACWFDKSGNQLAWVGDSSDPGNSWAKTSGDYVAPTNAVYALIFLNVPAAIPSGHWIFFDDILFYQQTDTDLIVDNAVTVPANAFTAGQLNIPYNSLTVIQTFANYTTPGNIPLNIHMSCDIGGGATPYDVMVSLYRDATNITNYSMSIWAGTYGATAFALGHGFSGNYTDTPAAGTYTYYLKILLMTNVAGVYTTNRSMQIAGVKK